MTCGSVYLVGTGPGDPSLLTLRVFELLRSAHSLRSVPVVAIGGRTRVAVEQLRASHNYPDARDTIESVMTTVLGSFAEPR